MDDKRRLITSRKYQKGSATHDVFVAEILRDGMSGTVFQCEIWLNNAEQVDKRITSGNSYAVRKAFLNTVLNLLEDGWSKQGSASYGNPHGKFFDPAEL